MNQTGVIFQEIIPLSKKGLLRKSKHLLATQGENCARECLINLWIGCGTFTKVIFDQISLENNEYGQGLPPSMAVLA